MDVMGFLCASQGNSTVQLHESLVVDEHVQVQRLVSVVIMATVLERCTTQKQSSLVRFCWTKRLSSKYIYKKIFPLYGGKNLSRKLIEG
jgi:hypothetical protein